jgi:hypothetical protein
MPVLRTRPIKIVTVGLWLGFPECCREFQACFAQVIAFVLIGNKMDSQDVHAR